MVNFNWWGMYIRVSHEQTQTLVRLLGSGAAIDALLAASDDGNGVAFYITWAGWLWIENPPAWA